MTTFGGAGGIRTRAPHTASVMRSHCATAPIALRSSTLLTGVTPARATSIHPRGSRASSALPHTGSHRPPALWLWDVRVLLPFAAFRSKV